MKTQYFLPSLLACAAAISFAAGYTFWHSRPTGPAALVVTPRQYVGLMPGTVCNFTATLHTVNATATNVSTGCGTVWTCSPGIGVIAGCTLTATNAVPSFGWVQATCSGLTTRVYVKVSADGTWNPDMDADGDGISDATEITSNTTPDRTTLQNVQCRLNVVL